MDDFSWSNMDENKIRTHVPFLNHPDEWDRMFLFLKMGKNHRISHIKHQTSDVLNNRGYFTLSRRSCATRRAGSATSIHNQIFINPSKSPQFSSLIPYLNLTNPLNFYPTKSIFSYFYPTSFRHNDPQ